MRIPLKTDLDGYAEAPLAGSVTVIGVPSSAGARRGGQEQAPSVLRAAGLIDSLRRVGLNVQDVGDVPETAYRPDPDNPRKLNLDLVAKTARNVSFAVERAAGTAGFLIVLGGDCSITIGVLAGLAGNDSDLGVIYLDGDLDLNTPDTTQSGAFDGMVTAHLLGFGERSLARIGPKYPLVPESHLVYFGYNVAAGGIDPPELATLARSAALRFPIELVQQDPIASARAALAALDGQVKRILVHFDVDVTDLAAVDVTHTNGLSFDSTTEVLKIFLADPRCIGLIATEFNPLLDQDGSAADRLVALLVEVLGAVRGHAEGI